ncbi:hypothetical protein TH47_14705 [Thalassospira sp. MCCC 1A02803]|nr:hypothetical protein TH47_14705 [Thalassospira sp. MCCC 1A02803]
MSNKQANNKTGTTVKPTVIPQVFNHRDAMHPG